jgi:hypothetical protein
MEARIDAIFSSLHPRGDAAEISFQPLVHELHVRCGLLDGTIHQIAGCIVTA